MYIVYGFKKGALLMEVFPLIYYFLCVDSFYSEFFTIYRLITAHLYFSLKVNKLNGT